MAQKFLNDSRVLTLSIQDRAEPVTKGMTTYITKSAALGWGERVSRRSRLEQFYLADPCDCLIRSATP